MYECMKGRRKDLEDKGLTFGNENWSRAVMAKKICCNSYHIATYLFQLKEIMPDWGYLLKSFTK